MKIKIFLIILFFAVSSVVFAQNEAFKVLVVKGTNYVLKKSNWIALVAGAKIYNDEKIKIVDAGYIGVMAPSGKTIEFKIPGIYNVNDITQKVVSGNSSFLKKYANSLAVDFANSSVQGDQRTNMAVTGSVERGNNTQPVILFMPMMTKLIDDEFTLKWLSNKCAKKNYVLTIKKIFSDTVFSKTVEDTAITLKTLQLKLEHNQVYVITVGINGFEKSKSNPMILKIPSINETDTIIKELTVLSLEIDKTNAMDVLILASFYEKYQLYTSAIKLYEKAISIQPSVEYYKFAYQNFIDRNKVGIGN